MNNPAPAPAAALDAEIARAKELATELRHELQDFSLLRGKNQEPSTEERWFMGRAEELEAFVSDVLDDAKRAVVTPDEAATAIRRHLADLRQEVETLCPHTKRRASASRYDTALPDDEIPPAFRP